MWNTAVGIKNCKQLFWLRVAFTTQKKATRAAEMMSVECVAIFWVVYASSGEKSCLQFSIPTGSGAGVSHSLKARLITDGSRRENHKCERDRYKMVWSSFLGTGVTERNKKSTVAKVSRLRLPLCFSWIFPSSRSPEKLFKSFEVNCRYWAYP